MIAPVRLATAVTVAAVGVALALAGQAPAASAAEQPAGALISLDGTDFSESPTGSLFPAGVVLIPGGAADATFWVRNASAAPADLRVAVADATGTATAFVESLTLQAGTAATPVGDPVRLADGDCTPVIAGELLPAGATTEVHLVLAMSPDSDNAGQGASAAAKLAVSLSEVAGGVALPPNCGTATGTPASSPSAAASSDGDSDAEVALLGSSDGTSGERNVAAAPSTAEPNDAALPTLPFADGHPAFPAGWLGGLAVLAAGAITFVAVLRRRRSSSSH